MYFNNVNSAKYLADWRRQNVNRELNVFLQLPGLAFFYHNLIEVKREQFTKLFLLNKLAANLNALLNKSNFCLFYLSTHFFGVNLKPNFHFLSWLNVVSLTFDQCLDISITVTPHATFSLLNLTAKYRFCHSLELL